MTFPLGMEKLKSFIEKEFPSSIVEVGNEALVINSECITEICRVLKEAEGFKLDYLTNLTATDNDSYLEVVYHLVSLQLNHSVVLKVRTKTRNNPVVPSVTSVWRGADFQEREVYDLFGIIFKGHPNLKRIFLWEGFKGHPLLKDYVNDA